MNSYFSHRGLQAIKIAKELLKQMSGGLLFSDIFNKKILEHITIYLHAYNEFYKKYKN